MEKTKIIDAFLEKNFENNDDIVHYISIKFEELVNTYGYEMISKIEDACTIHMLSDDTIERRKAVAKLTKQEIFEVCATVAFLAGMCECYERLER